MISLLRAELDDPLMKGFRKINGRLNELADKSPHITYRFKEDETNDGLNLRLYDDPLIISQVLVAPSIRDLAMFGHSPMHRNVKMRFGPQFFDTEKLRSLFPYTQVLFYVEKGAEPTLQEGKEKLEELIQEGPSTDLFTFREMRK